jgi:hypothetical protein
MERYHNFTSTSPSGLDECTYTKSIVKHESDVYEYEIYSKKNKYIGYGSFFHFVDQFDEGRETSRADETVFPFNQDGFLEPMFKRKYFNHASGETTLDLLSIPIPASGILDVFCNLWKKKGIDFDPVQMRILSW